MNNSVKNLNTTADCFQALDNELNHIDTVLKSLDILIDNEPFSSYDKNIPTANDLRELRFRVLERKRVVADYQKQKID